MNRKANPLAVSKLIGEYLNLKANSLTKVLNLQDQLPKQIRLGDLLVKEKIITQEELSSALSSQRVDRLRSCPLFANSTPEELAPILHLVEEKTISAGEVPIIQDTFGDCFYVLARGEAEVYRIGEYGERALLAIIGPGETIGEMGYFSDGHRTASVYTKEGCELIQINYSDLETIFRYAPSLTNNFLGMITDRLRRTSIHFQEVDKRARIAEKSLESLSNFLDLSDMAALTSGIDGLIERIVFTASKVMDSERASLFILDATTGELCSKVAEGMGYKEIRIPIGKGIAGWVAVNGAVQNIPDAYTDERFDQSFDIKTGFRTRNILCGPVKNLQGEIIGVIEVINKTSGNYGQKEEALFKAFAYQTAVALENFSLYNRLVTSYKHMAILLDVTNSVSQILDLNALILKIVSKTSEVLEAERATLFLLDREKNELWSKVALGDDMKEIRISSDIGLAGYVAKTGEILNIEDAYEDSRFNPTVDRETSFITRNVICVPVVSRDSSIIGVTEAINKKSGCFGANDINLLKALTSQMAIALENAQLYRHTASMKDYLTSVQNSISNSILTLDNNCRIVTVNRAARTFFRIDQKDPRGLDFIELLSTGNTRLLEHLQFVQENRKALVDYDLDLILVGNDHHTVNVNFVPLMDLEENKQGLVLIFEDVTMERRLRSTLTRYMAKNIVDRILDDPNRQSLGGIKSKATIMFADIRGFTSIAEGLSAEKTVEFLNSYFSIMVDVIFANGGVLDKYIGDSIMTVFGVPFPEEGDALRAVQTTLQMHSALDAFNARRTAGGLNPIRIGIGVCTGDVVSGNIGSEKRMEYTVIGDEVNVASRLESLCAYYGVDILIGETTFLEIQGRFTMRPVDLVLIRGKKKPVYIFQVLCEGQRPLTDEEGCFDRGLLLYRQNNFARAAEEFLAGCKGDHLCKIFLDRCRNFLDNPPHRDWNGMWIFDEKTK